MSEQSWLKEFYPKDAQDTTVDEAVAHTLRKWDGLRVVNLRKHKIRMAPMWAGPSSCALCYHYDGPRRCTGCPAVRELGVRCYEGGNSPYAAYSIGHDPYPAIALLKCLLVDTAMAQAAEAVDCIIDCELSREESIYYLTDFIRKL